MSGVSPLLQEEEQEEARITIPYLSHSRVNRYLHCPEQYRLHYVENLRPRCPSANLVFGQTLHQSLAALLRDGQDPQTVFSEAWAQARDLDLTFSRGDSWEKLKAKGDLLLQKFLAEDLGRLGKITAVEERFSLTLTGLDLPFIGVIDLVADLDGKRTVVDFKTAGASYQDHQVALSDQLTAYQLAEPEAEAAALCVLVKTKEVRIEWHLSGRSAAQLQEYLAKLGLISHEITAGHFYKRPGTWCSWCDFLPVCLGDRARAEETLIQVR